ncbi:MAG: dipeptidase [Planctomycetaceae bacterium]|nr:dipeptidase [Planctomycetaceae bacterium]
MANASATDEQQIGREMTTGKHLIAAMVVLLVALNISRAEDPLLEITPEARRIHNAGMLFDGHNDLPWQISKLAGGSLDRIDITQRQPELHTDLPKLKESGLKAQFWSVYVSADTLDTQDSLLRTLEQISLVQQMVKQFPDHFEMAATAADVERIAASGKIASMMGVEGGHSIEGSLQTLQRFYDLGVRYMTLTHNRSLDWATSCTDEDSGKGLSPFGEEIVREMNRMGMLVDLSHVSVQTMHDALRVTAAPVIFSHSSARAICDHSRNVPDEILRKLPENGGVVLINFMSGFVVPTEELKANEKARGTWKTVVDHIEHVIKTAGIDHVGLGSDYDGVTTLPVGLEDVTTYPRITQELLNRSYTESEIHQILGGNVLRVLKQAERVAEILRSKDADKE